MVSTNPRDEAGARRPHGTSLAIEKCNDEGWAASGGCWFCWRSSIERKKAGAMRRKDGGSGRVSKGGSRFRLFVHSLDRVRGLDLTADACPFEEECAGTGAGGRPAPYPASYAAPNGHGSNGHAPNGHGSNGSGANGAAPYAASPNGLPGFGALAAARRWSQARPYFRGRRPMAFACPGGQGQAGRGCPLAAKNGPAEQAPAVTRPAPVARPSTEAPREAPGLSRVPARSARILPMAQAPPPEGAPLPRAAESTSSGRRTTLWSSPGSRHAG